MAKKDRELLCKLVARGVDFIDAMTESGYNTENPESAERQRRNLMKDEHIQRRIAELKEYYQETGKDKQHAPTANAKLSARAYLEQVLNSPEYEPKLRLQAAISLLPYDEAKIAPQGKKDNAIDTAKKIQKESRFGVDQELLGMMQ